VPLPYKISASFDKSMHLSFRFAQISSAFLKPAVIRNRTTFGRGQFAADRPLT